MLLVASETGHVYTFATRKLQPMITSESGKALIQTCLNSPDPSVTTVALDQRMSATGYEEPDLSYSSHDGVNIDKVGFVLKLVCFFLSFLESLLLFTNVQTLPTTGENILSRLNEGFSLQELRRLG